MSNVIMFPGMKRNFPAQRIEDIEDIIDAVEESRREHIEYVVDEITSQLMGALYDDGFDLGKDECVKATALFIEAFRSALCKTSGLHHPLHDISEKMFILDDEKESVDIISKED